MAKFVSNKHIVLIFPEFDVHRDIANMFLEGWQQDPSVSAGFVSVAEDQFWPHGRSVSMNVGSADSATTLFGQYNFIFSKFGWLLYKCNNDVKEFVEETASFILRRPDVVRGTVNVVNGDLVFSGEPLSDIQSQQLKCHLFFG